jgi:hypothetical protein
MADTHPYKPSTRCFFSEVMGRSHAGFAGNVHFSSSIVRFSLDGMNDQVWPQCLLNRVFVHAMNNEN